MQNIHSLCAVLLASGIAGGVFAQNKVTGRVVDATTNEPVIGATVTIANEHTGTLTDIEGNFTIDVKELPTTIHISFIGYKEQQVDVYDATEAITIPLTEEQDVLQEVVVVGYGVQKRKELTGAIASVGKETLKQVTTSFDNLLGGAVSGLNVSQSSGLPGASSSLRIRGGNSITGKNEPLYVIDGMLIYNDNSTTSTGVTRATSDFNPLASINPSDIESIEVLKDVSASAIYGSRGANGVIIITTRSGKKGKNNMHCIYSIGWQTASKKLDLMRADDWGRLYLEIATPNQLSSSGLTEEIVSSWGAGSDWQDAALRTATTQNHQLSISGGDEKTRYLISGNFSDQDGILLNTGFKRYTGRVNLERDLFDNFTVGVNITAGKAIQNGITDFDSYNSYVGGNSNAFEYVVRIPRA
ncbi:MAG TPA: TonB-dependent receptor, partial [Parabacteroides sp.]|nr:TonB-dependent receptor [Parabacteroides sp.]